ncbi:protein associated with UVRAG as autophagy enhancer isoform X2 [Bufo bufo]|uniref:protein associated with UVRAG as autophagy enhancer isoform X2 n=1 Tax=Bufo bufo TaxID=8384 RepID=UPI001ABE921C|nr:protein associated with UVRAG as autophagy enhancer isoform X2 [Bufo bufo]
MMYSFALHCNLYYYEEFSASLPGNRLLEFPEMSVQALTLTSYNTKQVQNCARAAQVVNDNKRHSALKPTDVPDPPLSMKPRIPTILFPEGELPRPAVIGVGGSYGSYTDSATAIKEILSSVLKIPSSIKSTLSVNAHLQDSDAENWEDSSTGGHNEDLDSDSDGIPLLPCTENDIRFNRHMAVWDNSQSDFPVTPPSDSLASSPSDPITRTQGVPELELAPYLKCNTCSEVILPGSELTSPLNRRFSSPSITPLNLSLHNPPLEQFTEASTVEDHRRSWSYSNIFKVSGNLPTSSTEALHHSRENLFEPTVCLEEENGHFLAADLFMSLVEVMKSSWQYEQWRTEGGMQWLKKDAEETCYRRCKANSESATSVDSGYEGLAPLQNSPVETIFEEEEYKCPTTCENYEDSDEFVIIEMEDYEKLSTKQSDDTRERTDSKALNSAEQTARNLYRAFRQQWARFDGDVQLPAELTIETLSCKNAIPEEFESSASLVEEIKRFRMRDTEDWSPPRFQIISAVHLYIKRDEVVASQNFLCVGCGTKVELRYTNRLRYCDYLGKYFCDCCHHYSESSIPGRILSKWNFSKYYVSNFSKSVLDKIWDSHTFNVQTENPALYKKVKDLNRVKEVQEQLIHIRKLVTTCRFAESVVKAFEEVPSHLTQTLHLFTLGDLSKVKQKSLLPGLRELLALAVAHVEECELCKAKGFICEFCQNSSVIFPFQTETCRRCEACKACYHKDCFKTNDCPKCLRIMAREALKSDLALSSSGKVDSSSTT